MLRTYLLAAALLSVAVPAGSAEPGKTSSWSSEKMRLKAPPRPALPADDKCDLRVLPAPPSERGGVVEQWIVSGPNERCEARRLATLRIGCMVSVEFDHRRQWFECKNGLIGRWGSRQISFFDDVIAPMAATSKVVVPAHRKLREGWLAPVDSEGLFKNYPVHPEDDVNDYPRRFTRIGTKIALPNPVFKVATQTLHYTTMKGEKRAAVSGEAALGCLKVHFISWVAPNAAAETEKRLASFLGGVRLEPVALSEEQRKEACAPERGR